MNYRMIGLGDLIALFTSWLGIQPGPDCGCQQRQELLNNWSVPVIEW